VEVPRAIMHQQHSQEKYPSAETMQQGRNRAMKQPWTQLQPQDKKNKWSAAKF